MRTSDQLFVITRKPYSAASKVTLAGWLMQVINHSGQSGTAGSVRSAATSKAAARGASEQSILQAGNWSSMSTFERFYNKVEPKFADIVLGK